jgi:hypothetical protein
VAAQLAASQEGLSSVRNEVFWYWIEVSGWFDVPSAFKTVGN